MIDYDTNTATIIPKGWGQEFFAYHLNQEFAGQKINVDTVKLMTFLKDKKCSIHFHNEKSEYFVCVSGVFKIEIWDNDFGTLHEYTLKPQDRLFVPKGTRHRISGLDETNMLLEVSTLDKPEDSIRIQKGD